MSSNCVSAYHNFNCKDKLASNVMQNAICMLLKRQVLKSSENSKWFTM